MGFLFKNDIKSRFLKIQAIVAAQAIKTFYRGILSRCKKLRKYNTVIKKL